MRNDIRQFEAKLYALRKTKDGTIVQLLIHPHDDVSDFVNLHIGTDLELAWTLGDPKPAEVEPIEVKVPKAALARGAEKPKRKFSEMSLPEQAGVRCEDPRFTRFIYERHGVECDADFSAADYVRNYCDVKSRAELSTNPNAAIRWQRLETDYQQFLTDETHGGSLNR